MRVTLVILLAVVSLTACKKYDEGPSISLLSKKARLTGEWEAARCYLNGEQLQLSNKEEMTVDKNGTFTKSYLIGTNSYNTAGNWEFSEDKESLLFTFSTSTSETWVIKKLTNKQMFIETTLTTGSVVRYEYAKKIK